MAKLICPHCGDATSWSPILIEAKDAMFPDSSTQNQTVYGHARVFAVTDYYHEKCFAVLECQSCNNQFIAAKSKYGTEDWIPVYPIPRGKTAADGIPEVIALALNEAYLCFAVEAFKASVAMCEVALEHLWREQRACNLKDLVDRDVISKKLFSQADEVRRWANIVKHEFILDPVSKEEAEQLLGYMGVLLDHVYVEPRKLADLTEKRKRKEAETRKGKSAD